MNGFLEIQLHAVKVILYLYFKIAEKYTFMCCEEKRLILCKKSNPPWNILVYSIAGVYEGLMTFFTTIKQCVIPSSIYITKVYLQCEDLGVVHFSFIITRKLH